MLSVYFTVKQLEEDLEYVQSSLFCRSIDGPGAPLVTRADAASVDLTSCKETLVAALKQQKGDSSMPASGMKDAVVLGVQNGIIPSVDVVVVLQDIFSLALALAAARREYFQGICNTDVRIPGDHPLLVQHRLNLQVAERLCHAYVPGLRGAITELARRNWQNDLTFP